MRTFHKPGINGAGMSRIINSTKFIRIYYTWITYTRSLVPKVREEFFDLAAAASLDPLADSPSRLHVASLKNSQLL